MSNRLLRTLLVLLTLAGSALAPVLLISAIRDAAPTRSLAAGVAVAPRTPPATPTPAPAPALATPPPTAPACDAAAGCAGQGPIVALGDSVTYGYGQGVTMAVYGPPPSGSFPWDLERLLGVTVVNAGLSGDTAHTALHPPTQAGRYRDPSLRIPALLARHPRLMIVGYGSAEAAYGVPIDQATADLASLLDALGGIPVVIVGTHIDCSRISICAAPQPVEYTAAWDARLHDLAARYHAGLVTDVLRGLAEAGDMTDSLHPNLRGYAVVASRIAEVVRQTLDQPAR
jgi:lysophospholipase L1-like esterase